MISSDTDGRVYANVYRDVSGNKGDNLNERIEMSSSVKNKLETVKSGDEMRVGPVVCRWSVSGSVERTSQSRSVCH